MSELPEHIQHILETNESLDVESIMSDERMTREYGGGLDDETLREALEKQKQLVEERKCALCERDCTESPQTILTIHGGGVVTLHCSGTCLLEYNAMQWLMDSCDEIVQRIQMRANVPFNSSDQGDV